MKPKHDSDDMDVGILRTVLGYGLIIAGVAIGIILLIAGFCKL